MSAPSPVMHPAPTRPSPMRSTALGIVALSLGAVALLVSWVPWVNLLGLVLALGGLVTGGIVAVRGRAVARGLGIAGASLSVVALVVVMVPLGADAVGEVRERGAASEPAPPPAATPEANPAEPSADPAPVETSPAGALTVDVGEELDLDGVTGMIDQLNVGVVRSPGAPAGSGGAPESASLDYRLVLDDGSGSAPFELGDRVETSVVDAEGTVLTADTCSVPDGGQQLDEPVPTGSLSVEQCVDLPTDYDGRIALMIETPDVAGSPVHVIAATVSIPDLMKS